jgi:hypothetical protein
VALIFGNRHERILPLLFLGCLAGGLTFGTAGAEEKAAAEARAAAASPAGDGGQEVPEGPGAAPGSGRPATGHAGQHRHEGATLEDRVRALTLGLELDAAQQAALRKVLLNQREQVMKVWSDPSPVPAAYRIAAVKAITDHTADQIRALLNEEQRKKYNPPRRPSQEAEPRPDVAAWMDAIGGHVAAPAATH